MKKLAEVVNKSVSMEKNSIEKMCSCESDEAKDMSSSGATDTCGDGSMDGAPVRRPRYGRRTLPT